MARERGEECETRRGGVRFLFANREGGYPKKWGEGRIRGRRVSAGR